MNGDLVWKSCFGNLNLVLNAGLSADQVLADAEEEFVRVQREMYVVVRQLWSRYVPGKPLPPDDEAGRRETIAQVTRAVSQEHGSPESLVADVRRSDRFRISFAAKTFCVCRNRTDARSSRCLNFGEETHWPIWNLPFRSIRLAQVLTAVSPPPADWGPDRVRSFLEEYNQHMLQILTIHEAYPGHYVQLEYSNRCPSLIRKVLQSGVFIEGWAVYTEQMMLDQGYGDGSLPLRLNQLKFYLRAVANTILDHKMHRTDFSDEEAFAFLWKVRTSPKAKRNSRSFSPSKVPRSSVLTSLVAWDTIDCDSRFSENRATSLIWAFSRSGSGSRICAHEVSA